jgi:hypothetical protein
VGKNKVRRKWRLAVVESQRERTVVLRSSGAALAAAILAGDNWRSLLLSAADPWGRAFQSGPPRCL